MNIINIETFNVIGISIRTTNESNQSAIDIPELWNKFFSENIMEKIPNKIDNTVYCVYTDYEKDHTKPYTTILGCKVKSLDKIPTYFTGVAIQKGKYDVFNVKGKLSDGVTVFKKWLEIWNVDIRRTYTTDFEVYGEKANDPDNGEMDIFVAVK